MTVSGGGVQPRIDASINQVPRHIGEGLAFLGQSLTASPRQSRFSRPPRPSRLSQPDTKVRFREDGREGIIDGLTELLVLTDEDGVALMVRQKGEYRRVVTQQRQTVFTPDRWMKAA